MWIQVRSMDGRQSIRLNGLSKLTKIEDIRKKLVEHFDAPPERQKLFYWGKQMVDGYSLFDYNVKINDIVQVLISQEMPTDSGYESCSSHETHEIDDNDSENGKTEEKVSIDEDLEDVPCSRYYKVGDLVDARDYESSGTWFEAKITKIMRKLSTVNGDRKIEQEVHGKSRIHSVKIDDVEIVDDDNFHYYVLFDGYEADEPLKITFKDVRPRAHELVKLKNLKIGEMIMGNYNTDNPAERGHWFDVCVTNVTKKSVQGTVLIGVDCTPLEECNLKFLDELYRIEVPVLLSKRSSEMENRMQKQPPPKRHYKPNCDVCKDNDRRKCKNCGCSICGGKSDQDKQILCDECNLGYHIWCLTPPLKEVPCTEEWYCPTCKNDATEVVGAGEKLKDSKKKSKMASVVNPGSRDWGKGMACVGRTKECTIVPANHFGPIPNVPVGTTWKFRLQASEAGVHRPHVAGIHGRSMEGAYSIVLSGGYVDDVDNGDEFTYSGSGGRDLSGNKRTAVQSSDQVLSNMNLALARNCNVPVNKTVGAEAKDWRAGKAVRVIRSCKHKSTYAPEVGIRYDGLYKVVKYWPEKGKSGFLVWRYMFRRDDPTPAPWTKEGKKLTKKLGLTIQFPEGFLEAKMEKNAKEEKNVHEEENKKKAKKRLNDDDTDITNKKARCADDDTLSPKILDLIKSDTANDRYWKECMLSLENGTVQFLKKMEEVFLCICCQEVVYIPVTTECQHNVCKPCLKNSFKAEVYSCPACRAQLGKDYEMKVNKTLRGILTTLLPGYENGRD